MVILIFMQVQKQHTIPHYTLVLSYVCFAVSSFFYFSHSYDADAFAYLTITEQITNGNLLALLNGYWSGLLSIVLIPLYLVCSNGIIAFELTNLCIGLVSVLLFYKLLTALHIQQYLNIVASCSFGFVVSIWCMVQLNADVLFLLACMCLLYCVLSNKLFTSYWLVGNASFLYFAKSYGLFYFILLIIFLLVRSFVVKQKISIKIVVKNIALLFILLTCWGFALRTQYGRFTLSETSIYNNYIYKTGKVKHVLDTMPFIQPKPYNYTPWDNVTTHLNSKELLAQQSLFTSSKIKQLPQKCLQFIKYVNTSPRYGMYIIMLSALLVWYYKKNIGGNLFLIISSGLLFALGYILFFVEYRYLLYSYVAFYIGIVYVANNFLTDRLLKKIYLQIIILSLCSYIFVRWGIDAYRYKNNAESVATAKICKVLNTIKTTDTPLNYVTETASEYNGVAWINKLKKVGGVISYKTDSIALQNDLQKYTVTYIIVNDSTKMYKNIEKVYSKKILIDSTIILYIKN